MACGNVLLSYGLSGRLLKDAKSFYVNNIACLRVEMTEC